MIPPPTNDDAAGANSAIESDDGTISQRFDALGKAIRAGVDSGGSRGWFSCLLQMWLLPLIKWM